MSASQTEAFIQGVKRRLARINWFLAAALLVAFVAAWPLLSDSGFLNTRGGGDSPFLLQRVQQLGAALADGHFPVRWMPDAGYGFGYPFFNFYAPLSIYIASALNMAGFGLVWAIKIAQLLGFFVAAWSMFSLGRRWLGNNWAGLLASATYTLAPFHMVNVYVRGDSLAEFWAMAFYPLVILLADTLARSALSGDKRQILRAVLLFSLSFAALILSHNISALIFTPFLLLYIFLVVVLQGRSDSSDEPVKGTKVSVLLWTSMALVFGLALSAWFWLPALVEQSFAQLDPVTSGYFHFENHFRNIDLVQTTAAFDYDVADGRSFSMGLFQAILALSGLAAIVYYVWRKPKDKGDAVSENGRLLVASGLFIVLSMVVATLMITALSRPLWENLPLVRFTQFPWRFLSVQAFAAALATGGLALLPRRKVIVPILVFLLIMTSLGNLHLDFLDIADEDITSQSLAEYEWFTGNIGSTVSAEYLPDTVIPRPFTSSWLNDDERNAVQVLDGDLLSADHISQQTSRQSWTFEGRSPSTAVVLPTLFWPGWSAKIDGEAVEIWPAPGSGLISLEIPAGPHQVDLRLTRTPVRWAGELISVASILVLAALLIWAGLGRLKWKTILVVIGAVFVILILVRLWPSTSRSEEDLSWDFPQLAYLHHAPGGIAFSDGSILESYTYDHEDVIAGDSVVIALNWNNSPVTARSIDLVTPAITRFSDAPIVANQTNDLNAGQEEFEMKVPENAPAGLYTPRLLVEGASALTSSGNSRGDLFLRPIRIKDALDSANSAVANLDARPILVRTLDRKILEVQLQWLTRVAQTHNFNFSLRLVDSDGLEIAQIDGQPGYGFLPSSLWSADQWIDDWISLSLPSGLAESNPSSPYALVVRLYEVETGQVVLIRRLGELIWRADDLQFDETRPSFSEPTISHESDVVYADSIELLGYDQVRLGDTLNLALYWLALEDGSDDFYHFVHLIDPSTGDIIAQHDGMPQFDTYPTSQWTAGEIIVDPVVFDLRELAPGPYQLAIGLYRDLGLDSGPVRFERLYATDGVGNPLPGDRFLSPDDFLAR
ncbi:MAG TPA: 6-pyruvoyl-tetrahydropterin synthase-related protein [candidate division Zixibacteria bacterium]|nr:6-pyruvoyl-tetrahydropterin synthase-related protein [candidate division Zixibacteria bacterium]